MAVVILGLCTAIVYGAADFCGGAASRRSTSLAVMLLSQPVGLVLLLPAALVIGESPTAPALAWGFLAGLAGGVGILVFYDALAKGPMSVVAPISGVTAAILPVIAGMLSGERLAPVVIAGILLCLSAVVFVSMEQDPARESAAVRDPWAVRVRGALRGGPALAIVAGAAFGVFFILLDRAGDDGAEAWVLIACRAAGLLLIVPLAVAAARKGALPNVLGDRTTAGMAGATGILDSSANVLYLLTAQAGMLSIAAVLTSLYPAFTVLLACLIYGERLRLIQRCGLGIAGAGVVLVTVG